jgi:hypothetical protein
MTLPVAPVGPGTVPAAGLLTLILTCAAFTSCTSPSSRSAGPAPSIDAAASQVVAPPPPASPVPSPSGYPSPSDRLAADVRSRTATALSALSLDAGSPRVRVEGDRFILVDVNAGRSAFDDTMKLTHDALAVLYDGRLFELPERGVIVWLFGTTDRFNQWRAKRSTVVPHQPVGLYDPNTREIFVDVSAAGYSSCLHEIGHPLWDDDFPRAPRFLKEGLASFLELVDLTTPGEIHARPDHRIKRLREALASPRAKDITLEALFALNTDEDFARDASLHYQMARESLRWLDTAALDGKGGKLWPFYQAWRTDILKDPTGEASFTRVVGVTPARASAAWLKWVRSPDALR